MPESWRPPTGRASHRLLQRMFEEVAPTYDLVNRVATWGFDQRWRRAAAAECLASRPRRVLDIGCGTGDLITNIARRAKGGVELMGLDYSARMLAIARKKAARLVPEKKIDFTPGDAAGLPFPDRFFDCVGISFAFRNLTYRNPLALRHFAEVWRVLTPGGRYVIVETSQPKSRMVRKLFHLYLRQVVSRLGLLFSGNHGAYRYLAESARHFYTSAEVRRMLLEAGFRQVRYRPLLWGVAGIHVAVK